MPPQEPSPTLLALAAAYPHDPAHLHSVLIPQFEHRLRLTSLWSIAPSSRVLDIGCGQGDSALVLAHAVTPSPSDSPSSAPAGHVTALDPAPGSYGSPYTLAQAHAHIAASDYGSRITFHRADAGSYLGDHRTEKFDVATLCHSLWYFGSRSEVFVLFEALYLSGQVSRVCMAEYVSKAEKPSQVPHELAVEAQRRFYALRRDRDRSEANVREAVDSEEMLYLAEYAKWTVRESGVVDTPGLLDGRWEVAAVLDPAWAEEVKSKKLGQDAEEELLGYVDKIREAVGELKEKGEEVATLDAKWAVMERPS